MALVGTLSFNFQVVLPVMARFAFHGSAATYAALTTAMAAGAVVGALVAGSRRTVKPRLIAGAALALGGLSLAAAMAPTLGIELIVLAGTGAASVTFAAGINSTLQLAAAPEMRGRVMALYSIVFLGSTPIGAPISGWLAGAAGPRSALVMGGIAALVGGMAMLRALKLQHAPDELDRVYEPLHVLRGVVSGERRARGRRYAELAHQRLRAVMPGAYAHSLAPEDLADVVRVGALERERDERAALLGAPRAVNVESRDRGEPGQRVGNERRLMCTDRLNPKRSNPIHRRAEADRLGDL
jgi:MFS family permease